MFSLVLILFTHSSPTCEYRQQCLWGPIPHYVVALQHHASQLLGVVSVRLGEVPHPGHPGDGIKSEHENVYSHRVLSQREYIVPEKRFMNVSSNLTPLWSNIFGTQ